MDLTDNQGVDDLANTIRSLAVVEVVVHASSTNKASKKRA